MWPSYNVYKDVTDVANCECWFPKNSIYKHKIENVGTKRWIENGRQMKKKKWKAREKNRKWRSTETFFQAPKPQFLLLSFIILKLISENYISRNFKRQWMKTMKNSFLFLKIYFLGEIRHLSRRMDLYPILFFYGTRDLLLNRKNLELTIKILCYICKISLIIFSLCFVSWRW
jgi:hypothetical protein